MKKPGYHTSVADQWHRLLPKAKRMRHAPTSAEDILWQLLRRGGLGARFRRQHPVGGYIPDFVCLSRKLVIEVDGGIHAMQQDRDMNRDALLQSIGFRVLRIPNERVMRDLANVLNEIGAALSDPRQRVSRAERKVHTD